MCPPEPLTLTRLIIFTEPATTVVYTLSLHDALPISLEVELLHEVDGAGEVVALVRVGAAEGDRSEEHTSELQSRLHLVCRLLLETKQTLYVVFGVAGTLRRDILAIAPTLAKAGMTSPAAE